MMRVQFFFWWESSSMFVMDILSKLRTLSSYRILKTTQLYGPGIELLVVLLLLLGLKQKIPWKQNLWYSPDDIKNNNKCLQNASQVHNDCTIILYHYILWKYNSSWEKKLKLWSKQRSHISSCYDIFQKPNVLLTMQQNSRHNNLGIATWTDMETTNITIFYIMEFWWGKNWFAVFFEWKF